MTENTIFDPIIEEVSQDFNEYLKSAKEYILSRPDLWVADKSTIKQAVIAHIAGRIRAKDSGKQI